MKKLTFIKLVSFLTLMFTGAFSHAGVILSVDSVVENSMGEHGCCGSLANMMNQQGLNSTYDSGITDFNTFTTSGVTHSGGDNTSWLSDSGVYSGYLIFDLGAAYSVENFAMWNGASGISASVNGFSLSTSLFSDFSVSTLAGNFNGHQAHFGANVYDMTDSIARYVRLDIDGNFGNSCCTAIGDIAFDVASVPEPANLAVLVLGLAGIGFSRKKKSA